MAVMIVQEILHAHVGPVVARPQGEGSFLKGFSTTRVSLPDRITSAKPGGVA